MPFPPLPVLYFDRNNGGEGCGEEEAPVQECIFCSFIFCFGYRFMRAAASQPRGKASEEGGSDPRQGLAVVRWK